MTEVVVVVHGVIVDAGESWDVELLSSFLLGIL